MRIPTLSGRQFSMLEEFIKGGPDYDMPTDEARKYDQRPFGSMLIRRWVAYSMRRRAFYLTREGWDAWDRFQQANIQRKHPEAPLTHYFDQLIGLAKPSRRQAKTAGPAAA
jgi:hypothetical protein